MDEKGIYLEMNKTECNWSWFIIPSRGTRASETCMAGKIQHPGIGTKASWCCQSGKYTFSVRQSWTLLFTYNLQCVVFSEINNTTTWSKYTIKKKTIKWIILKKKNNIPELRKKLTFCCKTYRMKIITY